MGDSTIRSRQMRAIESNAEYFGVSRLQLMENAGQHVASQVSDRFPSRKTRIAVFCGLGGNGGDGFVAARHLLSLGYRVQVLLAGKAADIEHEAAQKNWLALRHLRGPLEIHEITDSSQTLDISADVVVDALLGIGLRGRPRQPILRLIEEINSSQGFCLAVDTPSGLNADSGEVLGEAVEADLTVTFYKPKPGLLKATRNVGELAVVSIGLPEAMERFAGPGDVALVVKRRSADAHKGDFGRLLVVGGSHTYSGAPAFVALAALRTGVDLASVAAPEKTSYAIASMSPSLITIKLKGIHLSEDHVPQIRQLLEQATGAVIGPGLGLHHDTQKATTQIIAAAEELNKPIVLDADGLKAYAETRHPLKTPAVLTPHSAEYQALTGKEPPSNLAEVTAAVKKTAARLNAVILLKGKIDIISDGDRVKLNFTGNPGMTVGGTGDVLSGIVGALLAQQANPFEAATAAAFVNGAAGDFVQREKGHHMTPTDLLDWIPRVIDGPMSHLQVRPIGP